MRLNISIYTDGACSGNPGPGGWGYVVVDDLKNEVIAYDSGGESSTTNNRMEMSAILEAFRKYAAHVDNFDYPVIYSDSTYAVKTFSEWVFNWANNGWKKSNKKEPENLDIVKEFYRLWKSGLRAEFQIIKGHSGIEWNEYVDKMAVKEREKFI